MPLHYPQGSVKVSWEIPLVLGKLQIRNNRAKPATLLKYQYELDELLKKVVDELIEAIH